MINKLLVEMRLTDDCCILDLSGELTSLGEEALLRLHPWEWGLPEGKKVLLIHFSNIEYMNSGGIALMFRLLKPAKKGHFQAFIYCLSSHYEKLFRLVGLTEYMTVYPDEYAVLQRIEALRDSQ